MNPLLTCLCGNGKSPRKLTCVDCWGRTPGHLKNKYLYDLLERCRDEARDMILAEIRHRKK